VFSHQETVTMRQLSGTVLVVSLAVAATSCTTEAPPLDNSRRNRAIVQTSNAEASKLLREQTGAELVAFLPRTRAEVWQFKTDANAALTSIKTDARVQFTEALGQATSAYSNAVVALSTFTARDLAIVQRLTKGVGQNDYKVMAARPTSLNADVIDVTAQTELAIPLVNETPVFVREQGQQLANGDFTWSGRAANGTGYASLVVRAQGITGRVQLNNEVYSILPFSDGRQLITRETTVQFPPEHPPARDAGAPPPPAGADAPPPAASCAPADTAIDVFVTYSVEAKEALADPGGTAALAVVQTNRSFQNSKVPLTLSLVGVQPSAYNETGNYDTDVAAMKSGKIPNLKTMRDATAADLVVMLVANNQFCGMAGDILASENTAFAAVAVNCATSNLSFAHEVGHLFGARHDRPTDDSDHPQPWAHGYALKSQWRSVMAYPGTCNCPREEFWADSAITRPDTQGQQKPSGEKDRAEDARILREMGARLAQFRCRSTRPTN
jgi:hypothetical protein